MTKKFAINKLTMILVVALAVCVLVGALAYFTDIVQQDASITTLDHAVDIEPEPDPSVDPDDPTKPDPEDYEDPTPNDPTDDLTNWWAYLNSKAMVNYNPGDKMTLDFILENTGALDVKVRETFVITSSVPMTDGAPEFRLYTAVGKNAFGSWMGTAEVGVTMTKISDTQYKYTIAESSLAAGANTAKDYYIVFAGSADNDFQAAVCTVDYLAEAMQADGDWVTAATGSVQLGGANYAAVPAA